MVACPNSLVMERLRSKYADLIGRSLADATGGEYRLGFEVKRRHSQLEKQADLGPLFSEKKEDNGLFPAYTFDSFVVGPSNQLAHAAALSVVNQPGKLHNPLLLHSGVGLGKTHLMHAIGNEVKKREPKAKIRYCGAESFTNEMIDAIQNRQTAVRFKKKFRSVDLLLVDDIQFLAGREATQEEFFNTFNALYLSGKQIILTSDRHPQEIRKLEARLISRFSGGMVADIQPPELDLRIAILKQKAKERKVTLNEKTFFALAEQIVGSIRQLEGTLNQLLLLTEANQEASPEELVGLITKKSNSNEPSAFIPPEAIIKEVCRQFEITGEELIKAQRTKEVALPRQVAMYLLKKTTPLSLEKIGNLLGGRDHSTILYGVQALEEKIEKNPNLRIKVEQIKSKLWG